MECSIDRPLMIKGCTSGLFFCTNCTCMFFHLLTFWVHKSNFKRVAGVLLACKKITRHEMKEHHHTHFVCNFSLTWPLNWNVHSHFFNSSLVRVFVTPGFKKLVPPLHTIMLGTCCISNIHRTLFFSLIG